MAVYDKGPGSPAIPEEWTHAGASTVTDKDPDFPYAPEGWTRTHAQEVAEREGLILSEDHWAELAALQEYCYRHECGEFNVRELHDALDERFHDQGGYRYLYSLFRGGPIAQGCRLAGLEPPAGSVDLGFGSVV